MKNSLEGKQYTSTIFLIKQIEVMKIINFIKKGRQTGTFKIALIWLQFFWISKKLH